MADADAEQAQRRMSDRGGHAADLAVFPFRQFEGEPGIGHGFAETDRRIAGRHGGRGVEPAGAAGQGAVVAEIDAAAGESGEGGGRRQPFHLGPIFAAVGVLGIEETGIEAGLVAQKEQAFGIGVEAAEGVHGRRQLEFGERAPTRTGFGRELREHPVRFVEGAEHGGGQREKNNVALPASTQFPRGMRAVVLPAINEVFVADVAPPKPAAGEAVVALRAAALNHRDVWIKTGRYAGLKWPARPGSDGAGTVVKVGDGVDAAWIGREVVINASFGWGGSERAFGGEFSILGLPRDGTMAEQIAVPATQLAEKPAHLTWAQAAALPLAGLTAYRALFARAQVQAGERVLVSGIGGGVALFALQFALAAGAEVWVTSSAPEKIARAQALGAKGGFDYRGAEWVAEAAAKAGSFDVIVDSAGGDGFGKLVDAAAAGGRIVFYGATRGDAPLPVRKIFWRQLTLLGTTMGSPADWAAMTAFVARHRIVPTVSDVYPLAEAAAAFARMERGEQFGKIVLTM